MSTSLVSVSTKACKRSVASTLAPPSSCGLAHFDSCHLDEGALKLWKSLSGSFPVASRHKTRASRAVPPPNSSVRIDGSSLVFISRTALVQGCTRHRKTTSKRRLRAVWTERIAAPFENQASVWKAEFRQYTKARDPKEGFRSQKGGYCEYGCYEMR